jgi:hypothetical protein
MQMTIRWGKVLIGGLAAVVAIRLLNSQVKRYEKKVELSDNLNRWEGEGGNVPEAVSSAPIATPPSANGRGQLQ